MHHVKFIKNAVLQRNRRETIFRSIKADNERCDKIDPGEQRKNNVSYKGN